jgi:replicative DNA helicase
MEEAALGAALLERAAVDTLAEALPPEAFYGRDNRAIYEAILRLDGAGSAVDLYTVTQELRRAGQLEAAGGAQRIAKLSLKVGSAANVAHHARVIFEKYLQRETIAAGHRIVALGFDDAEDVADTVAAADRAVGEVCEKLAGKADILPISELAHRSLNEAYAKAERVKRGEISGVKTGLVDLDRATNGWQRGDLIVVAGRPSMGKTAIMLHFAKSAAESGVPAAVFSLEMTGVQLADRLLLSEADGVSADRFRSGYLSQEELQALEQAEARVARLPLRIDQTPGLSMGQIRAKARALHKQGRCGILLVDYLQLCREKGDRGRSREQEVSAMSAEAKTIARELNIPVILLSQLSREVEKRGGDKKPNLSDLRDSGSIEQDADVVAFVYRPEYYFKSAADESGRPYGERYGELIFAKHRNGKTGTVPWRHNKSLTKIFDDGDTPPIPWTAGNSDLKNFYEPQQDGSEHEF